MRSILATCLLFVVPGYGHTAARWAVARSANFRVLFVAKRTKQERVRKLRVNAERQLALQRRFWVANEATGPFWNSPCSIFVYPTPRDLRKMVKVSGTAGNAHLRQYRGTKARRINLIASDRQLFSRTLPHEIGHLVAWDLLGRASPLWAAEGMAAMAEQPANHRLRARIVRRALKQDTNYRLSTLMALRHYPPSARKGLFYAQAGSLTRYLVRLRSAPLFVAFLRMSAAEGVLTALKTSYQLSGYAELERRWRGWVKARKRAPRP